MALIVKKSTLPNAGKGLFTTKAIADGEKIIEYKGEIITWKEYGERVKRNEDGYLFFVNRNKCIDAFPTPQYKARYANDARGLSRVKGKTNNAIYDVFGDRCYIVADRDIKAGEEIFVDYTQDYWKVIRYNIKLRAEQERERLQKELKKKKRAEERERRRLKKEKAKAKKQQRKKAAKRK